MGVRSVSLWVAALAVVGLIASGCGGSTATSPAESSNTATTDAAPATTSPPATTAAPATTTIPPTTVPATTVPAEPPATTTAAPRPGAGQGFDDVDLKDPATAAALSVRAGSAFLMISETMIGCLNSAIDDSPAAAALVDEMVAVERGEGLTAEAAELAGSCMAEPGFVEDVRNSWIGTETEQGVIDCLTVLFDVEVDLDTVVASLQVDATEADIGGVTMESALACSANDLLIGILSDAGLEDITAEESQCIANALSQAEGSGETEFSTFDFIDCLSDGSHNSLAETQFNFEVFGGEGRCLNEYLAENDDPNSRIIAVPLVLAALTECDVLGRFVNDQNGGRFDDDEVQCIDDGARANPPESNADLGDLVNGCL